MKKSCLICERMELIKKGKNPDIVMELETGYVVVGWWQYFKGYTIFFCKQHVIELHELEPKFRKKFLFEMSLVGEAVFKAFKPKKLNYEMLGNADPHLHCHIWPRYGTDPAPKQPVYTISENVRQSEKTKPSARQLAIIKDKLKNELVKILAKK